MNKHWLVAFLLGVVGCSSSSSNGTPPCNENPWECPSGQTCWPNNQGAFQCLNSGAGTFGAACQNTLGVPTCGDGLLCFQTTLSSGSCTPFCDSTNVSHACPSGFSCEMAAMSTGGPLVQICVGATMQGDGGGAESGSPIETD